MESSIKVKNILILLSLFLLGVATGVVCTVGNKEDIRAVLESIRKEESVEVAVVQEDPEEEVISESIEEKAIDACFARVDISGAVKNPGVYCLEKDSALVDAVKIAGGFTKGIAQKYISMRVNLATLLTDNSKVYIPFEEDSNCQLLEFKLPKEIIDITEPKAPQDGTSDENDCVNINSASLEQLQTLTGVGPSTAQKIVDARPYEQLEDLLNVSGIGQATYDKFKEKICL